MMNLIMCLPLLFILVCSLFGAYGSEETVYGYENEEENLIKNWSFEDDIETSSVWSVSNGATEYVTDAHTGSRSVKIKSRTNRFGGVKQKVYNVSGNAMYYASAFVKTPMTSQTDMYFKIRMWVGQQEIDGGSYSRFTIGRVERQRASTRWKQIGGDFILADLELEYIEVFFELLDQSIEYLVDTMSLIRIPSDPTWKEKADSDIQTHRTNTVSLSGEIPSRVPYCQCEIKVDQTRPDFGFGSAIQSDRFNEDTEFGNKYRQFHYDHFNWAVFGNAMKWRPMEPTQYEPKLDRVDISLSHLEGHNITVRGHSLLWGYKDNNPDYVKPLTGEDLREEVERRVDYVVGHYKGRIREWDVINEWLHGSYYDDVIDDYLIQDKVFNRSRALDPDVELFVNDFQALRLGDFTSAIVDQVQELAHRGVPVGGIGIQSHLKVPVPVELLRKRLQIATAGGFPVSITELNVFTFDVTERAQKLDEALRVYFSNPGVRDVVFWFVSDQDRVEYYSEETGLFEGPDFVPNEAGQVLVDRLQDWQTHSSISPTANTVSSDIRAFHGAYNVQTFYKGKSVKNQTFYLNPGADMVVTMDLQDGDFPAVDPADDNC